MTESPTAVPTSKQTDSPAAEPNVACVIVAYNHAPFVEQCLDSAFAQTYENLQVIICDDASPDDSQQVIRSYLERTGRLATPFIAHTDNRGLCTTLNEALEIVDAEFLAFISADDWMTPERVETQVAEMHQLGDEYGMVCNNLYITDDAGRVQDETYFERFECADLVSGRLSRIEMMIRQVNQWFLPAPGFFYRKSAIDAIGGFDESLLGEDLDMTLRILHRYRIGYNEVPVVYRRELSDSLSRTKQAKVVKNSLEHIRIFRKHFGLDPSLDGALVGRIGTSAKTMYGAGGTYPDLRHDLAAAFRQDHSVTTGIYLVAATLRVPGRTLTRPIEWVRNQRSARGHA